MDRYDHAEVEPRQQRRWEDEQVYKTASDSSKPKCYVLDMFPYPSGAGLHVGHPKGYIATDIYSRYKRMSGFNVLHPMGFDAFGLPAENYAIKNKIHPRKAVDENIWHFKEQLSIIGLDYDWSRQIDTTDPAYYKWTQWIFLKLYEKGLAYQSYEPINWCPSCQTGLANEDIEDGKCERCGSIVEKHPMRQWVLKITDYADRLLEDLKELNWSESIKESQRNWIGRSEGAEIDFKVDGTDDAITVFTTRADTLFGVTYVVLAPEHALVSKLSAQAANAAAISAYVMEAKQRTTIERTAEGKEKTGVPIEGAFANNPANGQKVPIWVADYVVSDYGTGAVMAVPAHDERDHAFAKKYNLPIVEVIEPVTGKEIPDEQFHGSSAHTDDGKLKSSGAFDGQTSESARSSITNAFGRTVVKYKLRDWVFSRQRYWGEPIPVVHCEKDGVVPVPESELPVKLPDVESYAPTGTGESPLADISEWVNTTCPKCGGKAKRETNTMPQWAGSSWYYLRYMDPHNSNALVSREAEKMFAPVDLYVGGTEHATRHLIYARFWHKFLLDIGGVSTNEPFTRLINVGLIMAEDGRKMSKSLGNVVNPDDIVAQYGADTFRIFEMFLGPFEQQAAWSTAGIIGPRRFLERVWKITHKEFSSSTDEDVTLLLSQTITKVESDIERFAYNTAISALMTLSTAMEKKNVTKEAVLDFIKILAPFAPHICEEMWGILGMSGSIHTSEWPRAEVIDTSSMPISISVQINGKVRGVVSASPTATQDNILTLAKGQDNISKWITSEPKKIIYVQGKLLSIVV